MRQAARVKRLVFRNLAFIALICYISFTTLLLLSILAGNANDLEASHNPSAPVWSSGPYKEFVTLYNDNASRSWQPRENLIEKAQRATPALPKGTANLNRHRLTQLFSDFLEPLPVEKPRLAVASPVGNFYFMHTDVFVYSAYYDDRKEDVYIRLMALSSQSSSKTPIFCHFFGDIFNVTRTGERYELCENHNRKFGGYIFSCQVPEFLDKPVTNDVIISWGELGQQITVPLIRLRPPENRITFLDSYVQSEKDTMKDKPDDQVNSQDNTTGLTFALCVPPLFGDVSPHRLIEFIELSLLLGANHIFFYKHSAKNDILKVISYYEDHVTLLPWSLPKSVTPDKTWYYGQLLAHNDCMYRTMPDYDLVAFNDIDEFVVPHRNGSSRSWHDVLPAFLTNKTCALAFQSAFYDPGIKDLNDPEPITPVLTARSEEFSKVRTKVMVCPWRVFEVGIHHVSKQNRETWTVRDMDRSKVFLHHYRRCVPNYGMSCRKYVKDTTIEDLYGNALRTRYHKAVMDIVKS